MFSMMVFVLLSALSFVSCSDDEDDDPIVTPPAVEIVDPATKIAGTYSGQLKYGDEVWEDVYIVEVEKKTAHSVTLKADFFSDGKANFSIKESGSQYVLENSTMPGISILASGKSLSINYMANAGVMLTYVGHKD